MVSVVGWIFKKIIAHSSEKEKEECSRTNLFFLQLEGESDLLRVKRQVLRTDLERNMGWLWLAIASQYGRERWRRWRRKEEMHAFLCLS